MVDDALGTGVDPATSHIFYQLCIVAVVDYLHSQQSTGWELETDLAKGVEGVCALYCPTHLTSGRSVPN